MQRQRRVLNQQQSPRSPQALTVSHLRQVVQEVANNIDSLQVYACHCIIAMTGVSFYLVLFILLSLLLFCQYCLQVCLRFVSYCFFTYQ